jgi:hypothetical protein
MNFLCERKLKFGGWLVHVLRTMPPRNVNRKNSLESKMNFNNVETFFLVSSLLRLWYQSHWFDRLLRFQANKENRKSKSQKIHRDAYLAYTLFCSSLSQVQSRSRCMSDDMTSNRFFRICNEHGSSTRICLDLVGDEYSNVELTGDLEEWIQLEWTYLHESAQVLAQLLLTFRELTSTRKVDTEKRCDRINNYESETVLCHLCYNLSHESHLVFVSKRSSNDLVD